MITQISPQTTKKNRQNFADYLADWLSREVERLTEEQHVEPDLVTVDRDMILEAFEAYESVNEAKIILLPTQFNEGLAGLIKMDVDE